MVEKHNWRINFRAVVGRESTDREFYDNFRLGCFAGDGGCSFQIYLSIHFGRIFYNDYYVAKFIVPNFCLRRMAEDAGNLAIVKDDNTSAGQKYKREMSTLDWRCNIYYHKVIKK